MILFQLKASPPEDYIQYVPDRPNYDLRYYMLNDKAKSELGWTPTKNIIEELPSVVEWYVKNSSNL